MTLLKGRETVYNVLKAKYFHYNQQNQANQANQST